MRKHWHIIPLLLLLLATIRCKRDYNPPAIQTNPNLLVIDGFINAGANSTIVITGTISN